MRSASDMRSVSDMETALQSWRHKLVAFTPCPLFSVHGVIENQRDRLIRLHISFLTLRETLLIHFEVKFCNVRFPL
jgi:hypothetical protein